MSRAGDFKERYFKNRAKNPTAIFKGKDLSALKHPFWNRVVKRRVHSGRLLDIGCAEGSALKWAEKSGYETYGMDISEFAIKNVARKRLNQTELVIGSIISIPFKSERFDVITCFDVLEHLKEPSIALEEIKRCLKTGGLLMVSVPNIHSVGLKLKRDNWFGYRDSTHVSLLSGEKWNEVFKQSGLKIVDRFYDVLWDSPYFKYIPVFLQHLLFKPWLLVFYWIPVRFPVCTGENLFLVAVKP